MSLFAALTAWTFEPSVVLALVLLATLYIFGLRDLSRSGRFGHTVTHRHVAFFALGLLTLALALVSPLDTLDTRLFAIHMAQHLLLLIVAPPLLLLGQPVPVLLRGAPRTVVRWTVQAHRQTSWLHRLTHRLTSPSVAWPLYIGVFLLWHAPPLYEATLRHAGVHLLEHLCFLGTGLLFWWVAIEPLPGPPRHHHGVRLLYVWITVLPNSLLGGLFIFSSTLWYPFYAAQPRLFGLSVLDDQRLGGVIMGLGDMLYVGAALLLFLAMLAHEERRPDDEDLPGDEDRAAEVNGVMSVS